MRAPQKKQGPCDPEGAACLTAQALKVKKKKQGRDGSSATALAPDSIRTKLVMQISVNESAQKRRHLQNKHRACRASSYER